MDYLQEFLSADKKLMIYPLIVVVILTLIMISHGQDREYFIWVKYLLVLDLIGGYYGLNLVKVFDSIAIFNIVIIVVVVTIIIIIVIIIEAYLFLWSFDEVKEKYIGVGLFKIVFHPLYGFVFLRLEVIKDVFKVYYHRNYCCWYCEILFYWQVRCLATISLYE